jgi:ubiquinone/menaquinone biosynthesis C-methylase UbiE
MRKYRNDLVTQGQASPPELGLEVSAVISSVLSGAVGLKVLDVGCGLGTQAKLIKSQCGALVGDMVGVDWSPATVAFHEARAEVYSQVSLCDSERLPFADQSFDLALSMENLEHLYGDRSVAAIRELLRVAKHVLISTPLPADCINFRWLYPELVEAVLDDEPISTHDFVCLESAVHKSTLFPSSMMAAGFQSCAEHHGIFFAQSANVAPHLIQCVGIPERDKMTQGDLKMNYLQLLADSASLNATIVAHPCHQADLERARALKVQQAQQEPSIGAEPRPAVGFIGRLRAWNRARVSQRRTTRL